MRTPLAPNWLNILPAQWWSGEWVNANLVVPLTGRFDVLDMPSTVTVWATPSGRRQVWVKTGAALDLPGRLAGELPTRPSPVPARLSM